MGANSAGSCRIESDADWSPQQRIQGSLRGQPGNIRSLQDPAGPAQASNGTRQDMVLGARGRGHAGEV
ncbi:MAG: hypothetical protein HoeaKO_08930 [Hoeflea alexandrii]